MVWAGCLWPKNFNQSMTWAKTLDPKPDPHPALSKAKSGENAEPHHQIVHDGGHVDTLHENHQVTVS